MPNRTTFEARCRILSKVWTEHRADERFMDFVEYNDIGLPLGYFISEGIALPSEDSKVYIDETFDILLETLNIKDTGFEELEDLL